MPEQNIFTENWTKADEDRWQKHLLAGSTAAGMVEKLEVDVVARRMAWLEGRVKALEADNERLRLRLRNVEMLIMSLSTEDGMTVPALQASLRVVMDGRELTPAQPPPTTPPRLTARIKKRRTSVDLIICDQLGEALSVVMHNSEFARAAAVRLGATVEEED